MPVNNNKKGSIAKNVVLIVIFGIISLFLMVFNGIMFSGITSCEETGKATIVHTERVKDSDGDITYKYTYSVNGHMIKSRLSTSIQHTLGERTEVRYNLEKKLIYTNSEYTMYKGIKYTTYTFIFCCVVNIVILIGKILVLVGVAGVMIHSNNVQNQRELEEWQRNNMNMSMNGNNMNGMNNNYMGDNNNQFVYGNNQNNQGYNQGYGQEYNQNNQGYNQQGYNQEYNQNNQGYNQDSNYNYYNQDNNYNQN